MLLFKSLTAGHSGIYTCVVTNTAGKANTSAELAIKGNHYFLFFTVIYICFLTKINYIKIKILVPPFWHSEPVDAAVLLGGALTVSCEARGHPPPTIYWTKFSGKISNYKNN